MPDTKKKSKKLSEKETDKKGANNKKVLDQEALEKELLEFVKATGYDPNDPNIDMEKVQDDLVQFLKDKNYNLDDRVVRMVATDSVGRRKSTNKVKLPRNIPYISKKLNNNVSNLIVFMDTTKMMPGLVCYTIEKIEPTDTKPWVSYAPVARVITQIHDNGVNGGTVFLTYNHKFIKTGQFKNGYQVISEDEVFYSPLTKEHADYMCRLLNAQARIEYRKGIKKLKELEKKKRSLLQKQKQK